MKRRSLLIAPLLASLLPLPLWAADPAKSEIVIGTTVGDFGDMVTDSIKPQLEAKGYKVKLVEFTDYVTPNLALADGSLDVNCFQHKPYLDSFSQSRGLSLTPITQVPTGPLGLYSGKKKSLAELGEGSSVAVPNDPTNLARALVMLQDMGWITLKAGTDPFKASELDVADNPHDIKLIQLEAAQLPRSREDVDFSVINGNFAASSGIPFKSGLFLERGYTFINWVVVRSSDKDKPFVKDVTEAYNSAAFRQYAAKRFEGYKFPKSWGEQAK
ncbi:D-methionine transport system substrate-binding protein [Aeromonas sp. RU39B]|uniref:MetQ/NlpA family ABC transporter substrate-binding protein n=1 Tax=Aeromonas sp. RU39B TaxID=1907416 RepID=UPI0009565302|nr:MetQ/NlpA family ABC transporter substrate-binding protein [Aeromonas sp. RU39B]SIQ22576.1 D-methionine transport system substrate-binding protein [Aeromonas sp. RU39B]